MKYLQIHKVLFILLLIIQSTVEVLFWIIVSLFRISVHWFITILHTVWTLRLPNDTWKLWIGFMDYNSFVMDDDYYEDFNVIDTIKRRYNSIF